LGISPRTLERWPQVPVVTLGRRTVRYRQSDLDALVARGLNFVSDAEPEEVKRRGPVC
jgi:hypothetical protein